MSNRGMEANLHELSQWCRMTAFVTNVKAIVLANLVI